MARVLRAIRELEAKIDKFYRESGFRDFPIVVPEFLVADDSKGTKTISNLIDFQMWFLRNIDALAGQFPIEIEVEDDSPDGKRLVQLDNIAESFANLFGLLATTAEDADASVNVGVHNLTEAIGGKVAALQAVSYLKGIADYLGYRGEEVPFQVPISVTPGEVGADGRLQNDELEDFLKPSKQMVIGYKCIDEEDITSMLARIRYGTEVTIAALSRPIRIPKDGEEDKNNYPGDALRQDRKDREAKEAESFTAIATKAQESARKKNLKVDVARKEGNV